MVLCAVLQHTLKIRTQVVCARHRSVYVSIHDEDIIVFCILFANTKLTFDRLLGLAIAGITCVNNCFFHTFCSFIFFCLSTENRSIRFRRTQQGKSKKYWEMSCFLKVLTIFFTLAVARSLSVRVRVSIPKSDRLSNEKEKKRYASFLSAKRLRVKVAENLRVR